MAHTVVSVGPYRFHTSSATSTSRRARSGAAASPVVAMTRIRGKSGISESRTDHTEGTVWNIVTP